MLTIGDIMTREVYGLGGAATLDEAAWALCIRGISGAPVRDLDGRLVGVLSKTDLADPERGGWSTGARRVRDVMTPALLTLSPSDPAMRAVALMVREGVHRVVVLDDAGELAGIVTPMDVLKTLLRSDVTLEAADPDNDEERIQDAAAW